MELSPVSRAAVALLVDGENLSKDHAAAVLAEAGRFGDVRVRRVYGKAEGVAGWAEAGFRLMATRPGKNAADMLLCVEAMALALRDGFGTVVIASSDRDFSYLAEQLREMGVQVVGVGEAKASGVFRKACSRFVELESEPPKSDRAAPKKADPWVEKVRDAILEKGEDGLLIGSLNPLLHKEGFKISQTQEGNWRKWLTTRTTLFSCDPKGPDARVRLKLHTVP